MSLVSEEKWKISNNLLEHVISLESDKQFVYMKEYPIHRLGYTPDSHPIAVYLLSDIIDALMDDGMSIDEAYEWYDYNIVRALPYFENHPQIIELEGYEMEVYLIEDKFSELEALNILQKQGYEWTFCLGPLDYENLFPLEYIPSEDGNMEFPYVISVSLELGITEDKPKLFFRDFPEYEGLEKTYPFGG